MKKIIFLLIALISFYTSAQRKKSKDYTIQTILTVQGKDSIYINELRFIKKHSAFDTKKMMYDKFGKWDKLISQKNNEYPILIWTNKKLFKNNNELFTIAASGIESYKEMYASVVVFDSKNMDCLKDDNIFKEELINYFSKEMQQLSSDKKSYDIISETRKRKE